MKRSWTLCLGVIAVCSLVSFGCGGKQRPATREESAELPLPLDEAFEVAREVLEERGFVVVKQAHGEVMTTLWLASFAESEVAGVWTRFAGVRRPRIAKDLAPPRRSDGTVRGAGALGR